MQDRVFITGAAGALGGALMQRLGARAVGVARRLPQAPGGRWVAAALPEAAWVAG
jgi:nucleoside-diphosphate-sugar epimerase